MGKFPIFSSGRIVRLTHMQSIRCYECGEERRGVFGDLRLSHFLQSGEEESQCGWCIVLSFVSLFLRAGVSSLLVLSAFFWSAPLSRNLSFIVFFSSDWINWVFFVFYCKGHGLTEKLLLIIFIFLILPFWRMSQHQ